MFNDLIDSGKLPVDDSQIVSFDTTEMFWKVKSLENSGNSSASIVFHLDSARTEILDPTTNIEIGVSIWFLCVIHISFSKVLYSLFI